MTGFQIPGLGQAKPNETLPPLPPSDVVVAAAAPSEPDAQMQDAKQPAAESAAQPAASEKEEETKPSEGEHALQDQPITEDAMAVDQPESPPSLTHALEAALGGLESSTTTRQPQAKPQTQEAAPPAELQNDQGENPEWEIDSSPYASSESSSSDSSDEDSDHEGYELLGVEETARLLMETEGGSEDEGARGGAATTANQVRTKNEMPEETIPRPDVTITPEMKIEELGAAEHIVENIMLIKAITPGEYQVLDTGSLLCNADRAVIGVVAETIGKVLQPMYTVRFNSQDEVRELGIEVGTKIFYPVDHASYVFTEPLKGIKGSDASNIHDEEVGDDEMEFSDDEKEAEYKRALKQKKRNKHAAPGDGGRGGRGPHPLRQEMAPDGGLNYDDDWPYKPLTRPPGYGTGAASGEPVELPPRSNFQRGGRRGDHRGRGGRGRGSGRGGGRGGYSKPRDGYSLPPQGHQQYPQQQQQQQQHHHQHQHQPSGPWTPSAAPPPPPQGTAPA
ncbi:H/ACA ribonucleoprotein complex non-core subunit NAF1, partial [Tolypocladium paradoxum]